MLRFLALNCFGACGLLLEKVFSNFVINDLSILYALNVNKFARKKKKYSPYVYILQNLFIFISKKTKLKTLFQN